MGKLRKSGARSVGEFGYFFATPDTILLGKEARFSGISLFCNGGHRFTNSYSLASPKFRGVLKGDIGILKESYIKLTIVVRIIKFGP